jgi:hypothetical protein
MPFEPAFMQRLPEFKAALAKVTTASEWAAFKESWFADQPWPRRSPEALQALRPGQAVARGGRTFRRAPLPDDLTAEARHQYFSALQRGFAATFPASDAPGAPGVAVRVHCAACELWSDEPGGPSCPECGRPLLLLRRAPPGAGR